MRARIFELGMSKLRLVAELPGRPLCGRPYERERDQADDDQLAPENLCGGHGCRRRVKARTKGAGRSRRKRRRVDVALTATVACNCRLGGSHYDARASTATSERYTVMGFSRETASAGRNIAASTANNGRKRNCGSGSQWLKRAERLPVSCGTIELEIGGHVSADPLTLRGLGIIRSSTGGGQCRYGRILG